MDISVKQYSAIKAVILIIFAIDVSLAKRNGEDQLRGTNYDSIDDFSEETCVSGYCIDPSYDKMEFPSSKPSHIRMNLEVIRMEST